MTSASRRLRLSAWGALLAAALAADGSLAARTIDLPIKALDPQGRVLEGIRFAFGGFETPATTDGGVTHLPLPQLTAGQAIKLDLPRSLSGEWFLIDATVHAPAGPLEGPAEVVLMRRAELRQIAAETRDATGRADLPGEAIFESQKRQILLEYAAQHGLTEEQLEAAIAAFGETDDWQDRGIAAYLTGEYEVAEAALQEAAEDQEGEFIETLRYLGATQVAQAHFIEATTTFRKALAVSGEDADLFNWLGLVLFELAIWDEAELLFYRALAIDQTRFGNRHSKVATGLNNLASLHLIQGDYSEAALLYARSLQIREQVLGVAHTDTATSLNNLAMLHLAQGKYAKAALLLEDSLRIREGVLGPEHPEVADSLDNLGVLHQAQRDYVQAAPLLERSLQIREKVLGPEHPDVARSLNNLGKLHQAQRDYAQAALLYERSLQIREKVLGSEHPDVAESLKNFGRLHEDQGDFVQAAALLERSLQIFEQALGPDHPNTTTVRENYASLLEKLDGTSPSPEELSQPDE